MKKELYTTQLQAGLGLIDETKMILNLWEEDISVTELFKKTLEAGVFPNVSARRLRNIVSECFAPRYMLKDNYPVVILKKLLGNVEAKTLSMLFFLYTSRANRILHDFITSVYWQSYIAGKETISNNDARYFVEQANKQGKTSKNWSDITIQRVSSYLTGCCADFGLLESGRKRERKILPLNISEEIILYIAYDLHFLGIGDNAILSYEDWELFGFDRDDIISEFKNLSMKRHLIFQTSGEITRISWSYNNWKEVIDAITQG